MGAHEDLYAGFFLHSCQTNPGQLLVYVLNTLAIVGWTLSHAPHFLVVLQSKVGQAVFFLVQNLLLWSLIPKLEFFFFWNRILSAKFKLNAKCLLSSNHRPIIMNVLLLNMCIILTTLCYWTYWNGMYSTIGWYPLHLHIPITICTAPFLIMGSLFAGYFWKI